MKKQSVLLLFLLVLFGKAAISQTVTLSVKNAQLEKVFAEIKKQTGYSFIYSKNVLATAGTVTIDVKNTSLDKTLAICFANQPLAYEIVDKYITVKEKKQTPINAQNANNVLKGKIQDESGRPIQSVSVVIPGSPFGTMSDANGEYTLTMESSNPAFKTARIIYSYVGYEPLTILRNGRDVINVTLQQVPSKAAQLDEVQVIGYGTTTKRKNTGAVSSITADEIAKETVTNPLTALQGHIAGVQITQDNGLPGGGVRVQIRGQGSAAAGTIPLYVVDGVPFTLFNGGQPVSDALNAYGTSGANGNISPFSMINPEDIERIDVLKDADATAIYGSRGANGVVLITTKKGVKGKTAFNVNVYNGIGNVNHYIPMMSNQQYLAMRREAFANSGVTPTTTNAKDLTVWDTTKSTDWQRWAIGGTAHTTNASASVSGGDAQNSFLFSSTYRTEGTVFPGTYNNNTFSNRLNAGHKSLDNKFNINMSVNYTYMKNNLPPTDLGTLYNLPPDYPIYNSDGTLNWTLTNPLSYLRKQYSSQTTNFIANMNIGYKILPGLSIKADLGYSLTSLTQSRTNPASSQNIAATATTATIAAANSLIYADNDNGNYIVEPQLEYLKTIGKGKLQLLGGSTFQQTKATGVYLTATNFASEALINSLTSAGTITASYNNYSLYKYDAFFGRANYNWDDKYIVDATFRRDGSSRFGPSNRFGNFGAVGAAWLFTKENFMKNVNFISFGKIRGSFGTTGNDQVSNYLYNALYSSGYYPYLGSSILVENTIANPDLHWETNKKLDLAIELSFFKDRIYLKADYYRNRSSDQLVTIALPAQSGTTGYTGNFPALVQNKGYEFELTTKNIQTKKVLWTTSFNLTFNQNKLVSFPGLATSSYSTSYIIGQPINVTQLYHYTGVNATTGVPTFQDQNGDGTLTFAADRIPMKVGTPYFGGLTNSITYKGFNLDFTFQFNHRFGYLNNTLAQNTTPYGYTYTNQSTALLNRWRKPGDVVPFPAAGVTGNTLYSTLYSSDYNWGDASFIKFKTLSLSYSLPTSFLKHIKMSAASVYLQGQNLYTWAKQKYTYDPETTQPGTGSGLGTGQYIAFPQLRTIVVGINLSL